MSFSFRSHAKTGAHIFGHNHEVYKGDGLPLAGGGSAVDVHAYSPPRFSIYWQDKPVDRESGDVPNGAFVEDVLEVCVRRLNFYQACRFPSEANSKAIEHVKQAIRVLNERREDREKRGVLGKNEE